MKAAIDKVNRKKLWKVLEERGINRKLINRIKNIYEETINRVIVGNKCRGVLDRGRTEARMPIEPTPVHNIYRGCGGLSKEKTERRCKTGKKENIHFGIRGRPSDDGGDGKRNEENVEKLERYLEEKELTLNADKSKMLVFCRKRKLSKKETGNGRTAR